MRINVYVGDHLVLIIGLFPSVSRHCYILVSFSYFIHMASKTDIDVAAANVREGNMMLIFGRGVDHARRW